MLLEKLNQKISSCQKCPLFKTRIQAVPGKGHPKAEILFVGEAPGKKEDETGEPFVGAAGKFLNEMLKTINLSRENVYIANICKCRPPNNRDPTLKEVASCWPWLLEQIKIIRPKLIITLGRHSMERFLPGFKISQIHGQALRRKIEGIHSSAKGQVFYVLYHPAATLYNGSMRETLLKDFQKIPSLIKKIKKGNF